MKIEITSKKIKRKIRANIYKLHLSYIDTDEEVYFIKTVKELEKQLKIIDKYIELLEQDHNKWCNIEPDMVLKAAKLAGVEPEEKENIDEYYDFFEPHPDSESYMARPSSYKVTYINEDGVEFVCKIVKDS